jgi:sterol 3beta-glucosyltransferase
MKILITTFGTRGDIQPFVALGKGLEAAGHEVTICTPEGFRPFVEANGIDYAYVSNEFLELTEQALRVQGIRAGMAVAKRFPTAIRRAMDDEWRAAQAFRPDAIVYHTKSLGSYHIAEKLGIPQVLALPLPVTPTREFPYPFFAGMRLGGAFNRFTYRLMALSSAAYAGTTNDFRVKTLGLRPFGRFADLLVLPDGGPVPVLYPYSAYLVPVPADFPPHVHVTGYWFLDQAGDWWEPATELAHFLEAGPPPVYIGFGSMGGTQPEKRAHIVLDALTVTGQRGVLASGWGGLKGADLPENVMMIDAAPHDWLFPQMAVVVHHGGAGTTAAGLRAGKPNVICPFLGDQPFWGWVVHQAGAGPKPIPQRRLTAERLAEAITTAAYDQEMQRRAATLGEKIRSENGVARAIEIIEAVAGEAPDGCAQWLRQGER